MPPQLTDAEIADLKEALAHALAEVAALTARVKDLEFDIAARIADETEAVKVAYSAREGLTHYVNSVEKRRRK